MSVLVGRVSNTYFIYNKISNMPRAGRSFSLPKPVVGDDYVLLLRFEGLDGATTWVDEAQGLSPSYTYDCVLTTAIKRTGRSSLYMSGCNFVAYEFPYLDNIFSAECDLRCAPTTMECFFYYKTIFALESNVGGAYIEIGICYYEIEGEVLVIYAEDNNHNVIADEIIPNPFPDHTWHNVKITVNNKIFSLYLDKDLFDTWESEMEDAFIGMYDLSFGNYDYTSPCWFDNMILRAEPGYQNWTYPI
jgi:hypothetical protein